METKKELKKNSKTEKKFLKFKNSLDGLNFRLHAIGRKSTELKGQK